MACYCGTIACLRLHCSKLTWSSVGGEGWGHSPTVETCSGKVPAIGQCSLHLPSWLVGEAWLDGWMHAGMDRQDPAQASVTASTVNQQTESKGFGDIAWPPHVRSVQLFKLDQEEGDLPGRYLI